MQQGVLLAALNPIYNENQGQKSEQEKLSKLKLCPKRNCIWNCWRKYGCWKISTIVKQPTTLCREKKKAIFLLVLVVYIPTNKVNEVFFFTFSVAFFIRFCSASHTFLDMMISQCSFNLHLLVCWKSLLLLTVFFFFFVRIFLAYAFK